MKDASSSLPTDVATNRRHNPCLSSCRMRCLKGKGALLVLVWNMLVFSYFGAQGEILQKVLGPSKPYTWIFSDLMMRAVCLILFYPLAGWLADVYFGRYRVIRFGLWLMWIGTVFLIVVLLLQYIWKDFIDDKYHAVHVTIGCLVFLMINIGLAAFQVNIIPFGTDQLQGAPAEELSSFVHWFFWSEYCGLVTYFLACINSLDEIDNTLIQAVVEAASLSVALILDFCCRDWLVTEPENQNPLRNIFEVVKYSAKTKYPQQRSAFTYCEEDIPSRINLGKGKYGGPFTNEQVEDVKTFMRILLMLSILGCSIVLRIGADNAIGILTEHIGNTTGDLHTNTYCYRHQLVRTPVLWVIVLGIPLHELVLYPLFHNYIPTMLRRIGIGIFIAIISIVSQLLIDLIPHFSGNTTASCIFSDTNSDLDIDYHWIIIPYFLNGLMRMLIYIAAFEFIISQSPHAMKGLLFGIFYALRGVFIIIACVIIIVFYVWFDSGHIHPSCGFWYYALNLLIGIVGFTIYSVAAKNYKNRQRDEVANEYKYAEVYYDKYCSMQGNS